LRRSVTNAALVGRYGGEEFLVAAAGLSEPRARDLAEYIVAEIREATYPVAGLLHPVTCSLGAVWKSGTVHMTVERLIALADEAMYEAKCSGKDRCSFRTLVEPEGGENCDFRNTTLNALADALSRLGPDHTRVVVPEHFERIANELNRASHEDFVEARKHMRQALVVPCRLTILKAATSEALHAQGCVRNISTGGIGLLTSEPLARGQAVEVALLVDGQPRFYTAGVVAFSRHVEGAVHEVGLQLFAHGDEPILSQDPIAARRNMDWVRGVVRSLQAAPPTPSARRNDSQPDPPNADPP
jgi:hypothetical protein